MTTALKWYSKKCLLSQFISWGGCRQLIMTCSSMAGVMLTATICCGLSPSSLPHAVDEGCKASGGPRRLWSPRSRSPGLDTAPVAVREHPGRRRPWCWPRTPGEGRTRTPLTKAAMTNAGKATTTMRRRLMSLRPNYSDLSGGQRAGECDW